MFPFSIVSAVISGTITAVTSTNRTPSANQEDRPAKPVEITDCTEAAKNLCSTFGKENVILAGGAVRDHLLGRKIRDFDFYIRNIRGDIFDPDTQSQLQFVGQNYDHQHLDGIIEVWRWNKYNSDIIFVKEDPRIHIRKHFDLGICMAYFDFVTNKYETTKEFDRDYDNKTLTHYISNTNKKLTETELLRIQKIQTKYPEYRYIAERPKNVRY